VDGKIDLSTFRALGEELASPKLDTQHTDNQPGCRTIDADQVSHD
jgi:hypothetical protein